MGFSKVLTILLLQVRCSRHLSLLEFPNLLTLQFLLVYFHCSTWLMQCSNLTLPHRQSTFLLPTSYFLSLHPPHPFMFLVVVLYLRLPLPLLTRSGFLNRMLEIFESEALNFSTLSCRCYFYRGIQPQLVFLFVDPSILCSEI